jgi:cell division septum initiation protein DivIVA
MSDTSAKAVERLAFRVECHNLFDAEGEVTAHGDDVADMLRALLAERDRLREALRAIAQQCGAYDGRANIAMTALSVLKGTGHD